MKLKIKLYVPVMLVVAGLSVFAFVHRDRILQRQETLVLAAPLHEFAAAPVGFINRSAFAGASAQAPTLIPQAFLQWRDETRAGLATLFKSPDLNIVPAVVPRGRETLPTGVVREWIEFESFDGSKIPAVIQYRATGEPQAAILLIPGHSRPHQSGLQQLVLEDASYQHAAATALARAGFATVTFELRGFGLLGAPLHSEHRLVAYNAILAGEFYKKLIVADALYATAALREVANVDAARLGVAGVSLGGEMAALIGALEPAFKAIYFAGYGGHFGPFPFAAGGRDDQPHFCHIIPGALGFLRRESVALLLAPRPVLANRGARENPPHDEYLETANRAWTLLDAAGNFDFVVVPKAGHEFIVEAAIEFFEKNL